jgi:hypothetical protein
LTFTNSSTGCSNTHSLNVTICDPPAQPGTIAGNSTLCSGSTVTYSVPNVTGVTYTWTVPADWSIISGQGTSSITVTAGTVSGNIAVTPSNNCGNGTARTLSVTANTPPTNPTDISGITTINLGQSTTLTASGGSEGSGCTYQWGTGTCGSNIISGQTSSSITVSPITETTYWVRRVGASPCEGTTTNCATQIVTITHDQLYTISGQVLFDGNPLAGVTISYAGSSVVTNSSGTYSITVNENATVTLTPSLSGYTFTPPNIICSNVANNLYNQDFVATQVSSETYTISGHVFHNGNPLAGVPINYTGGVVVTNPAGSYSIMVNQNATVTLTPTQSGYAFIPPSITCSNVTNNLYDQNFAANTVGISDETNNSSISVYPNPTTGQLTIKSEQLTMNNVDIYDVFGKILQSEIVNLQSEIVIDISHLSVGIYFVRISTETGEIMRKVLKE